MKQAQTEKKSVTDASKGWVNQINPIMLLKDPEKFKSTFYELTCQGSEAIKNQDYELSIKAYNKCLEMMDLNKPILKDISKYWRVCILGNLACSYQGQWKVQKSHRFCQKLQQQLKRLLSEQVSEQTQLKIYRFIVRLRFQHCALISQLDQHEKALELCHSTIPVLKDLIERITKYCHSFKKQTSEGSMETVQFRNQVTNYADSILNSLMQLLEEQVQIRQSKLPFYYWQKNPQKNQEQVKKMFVPSENDSFKRSILGVSRPKHWIDEFNIGAIMHMSQLTLADFENPIPIQQYLFKDQLYELIINCSVAHFTIATEMRFIDSAAKKNNKEQLKQPNKEKGDNLNSITKKYGYQEKSSIFRLSQAYHLKAIHIMAHNLKFTVPYILHLIQSYEKHYIHHKQLEPIVAINQQSILSIDNHHINRDQLGVKREQLGTNKQVGLMFTETQQNRLEDLKELQIYYQTNHQVDEMKPRLIYQKKIDSKHRSMGKFKSPPRTARPKKETVQPKSIFTKKKNQNEKEKEKEKNKPQKIDIDTQKQFRIKHQSMTQIKMVFKKKK